MTRKQVVRCEMVGDANVDSCKAFVSRQEKKNKNIPHKHRQNRLLVVTNKTDDRVDARNWASDEGLTLMNC